MDKAAIEVYFMRVQLCCFDITRLLQLNKQSSTIFQSIQPCTNSVPSLPFLKRLHTSSTEVNVNEESRDLKLSHPHGLFLTHVSSAAFEDYKHMKTNLNHNVNQTKRPWNPSRIASNVRVLRA